MDGAGRAGGAPVPGALREGRGGRVRLRAPPGGERQHHRGARGGPEPADVPPPPEAAQPAGQRARRVPPGAPPGPRGLRRGPHAHDARPDHRRLGGEVLAPASAGRAHQPQRPAAARGLLAAESHGAGRRAHRDQRGGAAQGRARVRLPARAHASGGGVHPARPFPPPGVPRRRAARVRLGSRSRRGGRRGAGAAPPPVRGAARGLAAGHGPRRTPAGPGGGPWDAHPRGGRRAGAAVGHRRQGGVRGLSPRRGLRLGAGGDGLPRLPGARLGRLVPRGARGDGDGQAGRRVAPRPAAGVSRGWALRPRRARHARGTCRSDADPGAGCGAAPPPGRERRAQGGREVRHRDPRRRDDRLLRPPAPPHQALPRPAERSRFDTGPPPSPRAPDAVSCVPLPPGATRRCAHHGRVVAFAD